jgi:hypothetical protein
MVQYQPSAPSPQIPQGRQKVLDVLIGQKEDNPSKRLARWSDAISGEFHRALPEYDEKKWIDDALGDELVKELLAAAMRAPSAENQQPWRFVVITAR